ncbi:uncharacterized protein LOC116304159 [Actinia tenebrosa]|uniref:Uncharacterized protein LOC116304159 n=1 Tax=Actinia tenebrosa TaxID=6105 RepID=A0A6P8IRC0_ACTTE|nr:uncharacterized protein LOC116304159 [Actinia tenebrosa]
MSNTTLPTSVFSPISTSSITPTPTSLSMMSTGIASTVTEPTQNLTVVGTTTSPSSGMDLKHRLLFVLLGSLFGIILIVVIVLALMCKYGRKANQRTVTPISTDASDEPHENSPPRPVWSEKSKNKNKK